MLSMRSITTCKSDLFAGQYSKVKKLQDPSQCHAVHEVHVTPDSKFDSSRLSQLMASATRALADTWPSNFLISIGKPDTTRVKQLPTNGIKVYNMQKRSVGQNSEMKQLQDPSQCQAVHEVQPQTPAYGIGSQNPRGHLAFKLPDLHRKARHDQGRAAL